MITLSLSYFNLPAPVVLSSTGNHEIVAGDNT